MSEIDNLLEELDITIQLLESLMSKSAFIVPDKQVELLTNDMKKYFKDLEEVFPQSDIESLYYKYVEQE